MLTWVVLCKYGVLSVVNMEGTRLVKMRYYVAFFSCLYEGYLLSCHSLLGRFLIFLLRWVLAELLIVTSAPISVVAMVGTCCVLLCYYVAFS